MPLLTPRRSADLADFFGVNIKLGWDLYPNLDKHIEMIKYLGIKHVRLGIVSGSVENFIALYNATGAKLCLISGPATGNQAAIGSAPDTIVATIKRIGKEKIAYIEQPNEQDGFGGFSYKGVGFPGSVALWAKDLHTVLKADPYTADIPIVGASVAYYNTANVWIEPYVDFGNAHPYASDMLPEDSNTFGCLREVLGNNDWNRGSRDMHGNTKLTMATEYGYYTSIKYNGGDHGNKFPISELANAKYTPRRSLFLFNNQFGNFKHGWLYELRDGGSNLAQKEEKFGLFDVAGTPKQSAKALKALIGSVTDVGANANTFTPTPIDITFGGDTTSLAHLLLQKSDGKYVLAVWRKLSSYQAGTLTTRTELHPAATNLTITLPSVPSAVSRIDTINSVTSTVTPTQTIAIPVADSVVLLEINLSPAVEPVLATLFADPNYLGSKAEFKSVGSYAFTGDLAYLNNAVSSIKVAPGYRVISYLASDYTRLDKTYTTDVPSIDASSNNYISSIKIEKI